MTTNTLSRRWFLWNCVAWLVGFVLYTPIAHGVTGAHPGGLTPAQILAHSIAVSVVGIIVADAQRRALAPFVSVPWVRILVAPVAFNIGYWVGSYLPIDWDTDILLGFLALGSAVWLGIVPINGQRLSAAVALLSFPVASVVVELALVGVVVGLLGITPDLQASTLWHSLFWITVGGGSGILGGWLSGHALSKMLSAKGLQPAAQRVAAADVTRGA
jgi:type III secretory pathway component EscS